MTSPDAVHSTGRQRTVRGLTEDWIDAFNAHGIDPILHHYSRHTLFCPGSTVVARWNRPDGTLRGRAELCEHFRRALLRADLHFV